MSRRRTGVQRTAVTRAGVKRTGVKRTGGRRGGLRGEGPRSREGWVFGRRPALEAIRVGSAREILVARSARANPGLRDVLMAAEAEGVAVLRVDPRRIAGLAGDEPHQGVAASVRSAPDLTESDLASSAWSPDALVVVLDGVTDPHNIGAVARTAEAAGASALVVRRQRGGSGGRAAMKASAGALAHLPLAAVPNLPRAVDRLKGAGFWVVGADGSAPSTIWDTERPDGRVAVVVGAEGSGISRLVRESCDELLAVPLRGRVGSLNVSVAAGVVLMAYAARPRERGAAGPREPAAGRPTTRTKKKD